MALAYVLSSSDKNFVEVINRRAREIYIHAISFKFYSHSIEIGLNSNLCNWIYENYPWFL